MREIITFVGKLNSAKGYDLFGKSILKILDKHKDWKSIVIGDEPREKLIYKHKNLKVLGFQNHTKVLNVFKKSDKKYLIPFQNHLKLLSIMELYSQNTLHIRRETVEL